MDHHRRQSPNRRQQCRFLEQSGLFTRQLDFDRPTRFVVCHYDFIDGPDQNYMKRNQAYVENQALKERQRLLKEKHEIEKNILQESKLETIGLLTTSIVHDLNNF